jgi:hypothetical protein
MVLLMDHNTAIEIVDLKNEYEYRALWAYLDEGINKFRTEKDKP